MLTSFQHPVLFQDSSGTNSCDPNTEICPTIPPEPPAPEPEPLPPLPILPQWSGIYLAWMLGPLFQISSGGAIVYDLMYTDTSNVSVTVN